MKKQSTTKGFAILSMASMIVKVLSLLYLPFLQNIITLEGQGVYLSAYQIFVWIYVLANSGIPVAISKLVSEQMALGNYRDAVKSFKISRLLMLCSGVFFSLFLFIFAGPIANVQGVPKAKLSIMALAPTILFTSIVSSYRGYFQGRGNMEPTAISQILEQVANVIFTLVFAAMLMKYGIEAGSAGGTIGTTVGALFAAIYLIIVYEKNKIIRVPIGFVDNSRATNKEIFKRIIGYSLPIVICVGMQYSGDIVDMGIVINRLRDIGLTEKIVNERYAVLRYYRTLIGVPIALISALAVSVLPSLSGAHSLKNNGLVNEKVNFAFRFCYLVAIPSAIGLTVLNKSIIKLVFPRVFGYNLELAGYMLFFGGVILILQSTVQIQITILQSIGKLYTSTIYMLIGVTCKIIADYIFVGIPTINVLGALFGNFFMFIVPLILNYRKVNKELKVKVNLLKHMIKPLLASILMGAVVYGIQLVFSVLIANFNTGYLNNAISTLIAIGTGVITYVYGLALFGGITKEDLNVLPVKFKKNMPKFIIDKIV
ncbi:putative polysaccharide biosynthesis protein [Clostridium sp. DL1XJH146]